MDEAPPDIPEEVCLYIRKLLTLANDHEILKGASFNVTPDVNALCTLCKGWPTRYIKMCFQATAMSLPWRPSRTSSI